MEKSYRRNPRDVVKEDGARRWKRRMLVIAGIALVVAGVIREGLDFDLSRYGG